VLAEQGEDEPEAVCADLDPSGVAGAAQGAEAGRRGLELGDVAGGRVDALRVAQDGDAPERGVGAEDGLPVPVAGVDPEDGVSEGAAGRGEQGAWVSWAHGGICSEGRVVAGFVLGIRRPGAAVA
jgi:hypothetical protein